MAIFNGEDIYHKELCINAVWNHLKLPLLEGAIFIILHLDAMSTCTCYFYMSEGSFIYDITFYVPQ